MVAEVNGELTGALVGAKTLASQNRCNIKVINTGSMLNAIMSDVNNSENVYAVGSEIYHTFVIFRPD